MRIKIYRSLLSTRRLGLYSGFIREAKKSYIAPLFFVLVVSIVGPQFTVFHFDFLCFCFSFILVYFRLDVFFQELTHLHSSRCVSCLTSRTVTQMSLTDKIDRRIRYYRTKEKQN